MSPTPGLTDLSTSLASICCSTRTLGRWSGFLEGRRLTLGSRWPYELVDDRDETVEKVDDRFEYSDDEEGEVMLKGRESDPAEDLGVPEVDATDEADGRRGWG